MLRISRASFSSPMRTVTAPVSLAAASSFSTTTCSSSASSTCRSEPGKSATLRVRFAVPPSSMRSSGCSTSDSMSTVHTADHHVPQVGRDEFGQFGDLGRRVGAAARRP